MGGFEVPPSFHLLPLSTGNSISSQTIVDFLKCSENCVHFSRSGNNKHNSKVDLAQVAWFELNELIGDLNELDFD